MTTHGAQESVRGIVHTDTVEGDFSAFKRGMEGVYQHCGKVAAQARLPEQVDRGAKALPASSAERVTAVVWANAYVRRRFGRIEHVCGHCRGLRA